LCLIVIIWKIRRLDICLEIGAITKELINKNNTTFLKGLAKRYNDIPIFLNEARGYTISYQKAN
jgi:hypothetical protein